MNPTISSVRTAPINDIKVEGFYFSDTMIRGLTYVYLHEVGITGVIPIDMDRQIPALRKRGVIRGFAKDLFTTNKGRETILKIGEYSEWVSENICPILKKRNS